MSQGRRTVLWAMLLLAGCADNRSNAELRSEPENRMVAAGEHRLQMEFLGAGVPAVVFDAGMIGGMQNWTPVRDSVAQHTQTVIFERAGFGESEKGPLPRTARQLSAELHAAVENAGISFPIILVGHSAGGLFSRVFAHSYPSDVAGLVLVDPAVEEVYDYMRESDPPRWANYVDEVRSLYDPSPGWFGQWDALPQTLAEARQAWPLPEVPTVILSALMPAGEWPIESAQDMEVWERSQMSLAERVPHAEHVILPGADHGSILREALLREKILAILNEASGR